MKRPPIQPELDLLLTCTRQTMTSEQIAHLAQLCHNDLLQWASIYTLADQHSVAPLVFANLQQSAAISVMPAAIIQQFRQATYQAIATKAGLARQLQQVLAFLTAQGQRVMLIKGAALDRLLYRQPWYVVHDVDLIIATPRSALPAGVLATIERFFWDYPAFEYEFYSHHDVTMNGVLSVDFAQIWHDAESVSWDGTLVTVMARADQLIAACINCVRKRFFRLKALLAVAELTAWLRQEDWPLVVAKSNHYQCANLVYAALLMAQTTLGAYVPARVAEQLAIHPLRARAIQGVMHHLVVNPEHWATGGGQFEHRLLNWALLLPYTTYSVRQIFTKLSQPRPPSTL